MSMNREMNKMVQKKLLLLLILLNLIKTTICESGSYTLADFYQVIQLRIVDFSVNPLSTSNIQNTITFNSDKFKNPQILIGVMQFDVATNTNYIGYKLDNTVNGNSITLTAQQFQDSKISQIIILCLIIQHQSVYIQKGSIIMPAPNSNLIIKQTINYQKQTQNPPQIQAYITGYLNQVQGDYLKVKLTVQQGQNSFDLIIERSDMGLQEVYYNYIEVYDDVNIGFQQSFTTYQPSPYYLANMYQENSYEDSSNTALNNGQVGNRLSNQRILSVNLQYPASNSYNFTQVGFFIGFTFYEYDITVKTNGLRAEIFNIQFLNNIFNFNYRVWYTSQILGITASYLYFGMLNCQISNPSNPINDFTNQACINQCQSGFYVYSNSQTNLQSCNACDSSCLTCNGGSTNNCLSCTSGNYLTSTSSCASCPIQCNQCTSSTYCSSCNSNYGFFFKNFCYQSPPPYTYCDQQTYQCKACNSMCATCSSNLQCLTCQNNYYLLNGICSQNQPSNSYCDPLTKKCAPCNQNCGACDSSLKCTYCSNNSYYFYFGICSTTQPPSTYCQNNVSQGIQNFCQTCHPACSSCTGPQINQCSSCNSGYYRNGNSCYCNNLSQSYNPITQQCQNCIVSGCASCQDDINTCDYCQSQYKMINNQCVCKNSQQYFDQIQTQCVLIVENLNILTQIINAQITANRIVSYVQIAIAAFIILIITVITVQMIQLILKMAVFHTATVYVIIHALYVMDMPIITASNAAKMIIGYITQLILLAIAWMDLQIKGKDYVLKEVILVKVQKKFFQQDFI
ncbi:transmembrane protein, putative (macronuclear) [Tetrahymena thermophila SB210]|uniref:Transmembrane protein, putative n=1 Tax=Tetrahymena thermophila (strain SB210) TaxID=312017 RepID=Q22P15_TETTS|nr:transmembrane protein, putative [Tetrahymena thermophila SB210]EAR86996.2 transmembrane protein, putative [Tetrahymena thermophila SB210]|eukprot:XP_001007241.2 transmembrane protein, putative [Tetrahymena thermophila SB210]